MTVTDTERVLTKIAAERQSWRDRGHDFETMGMEPIELLGTVTMAMASVTSMLMQGDGAEARQHLVEIATQCVVLLEASDETLADFAYEPAAAGT